MAIGSDSDVTASGAYVQHESRLRKAVVGFHEAGHAARHSQLLPYRDLFNKPWIAHEHEVLRIGHKPRHSAAMVLIAFVLIGLGLGGIMRIPTGFLPIED